VVARYLGRHGEARVAKVVLVSAVTPSVLQTDANPAGVPKAAFEGFQTALTANRAEFYQAVASGPFYNFDQPGVTASEPVIANWWRQGMMGGAKGQYDQVTEFIRQDYSEDLKKVSVPVLAMNGDADQVVPHDTSGPRAVKLVQNGTLKTYPGFPHGMLTTHADLLNNDLLTFIQS
jgi:non-heme chloroperoxidase